jgi:hypothetical protein
MKSMKHRSMNVLVGLAFSVVSTTAVFGEASAATSCKDEIDVCLELIDTVVKGDISQVGYDRCAELEEAITDLQALAWDAIEEDKQLSSRFEPGLKGLNGKLAELRRRTG